LRACHPMCGGVGPGLEIEAPPVRAECGQLSAGTASRCTGLDATPPEIGLEGPTRSCGGVTHFSADAAGVSSGLDATPLGLGLEGPARCPGEAARGCASVMSSLPRYPPPPASTADGKPSKANRHPVAGCHATIARPRSIRTNPRASGGWQGQPTTPGAVAWSRAPRACRMRIAVCATIRAANAAWAGPPQPPPAPPRQPPGPPCDRRPRQGRGR
jgi:hypothetical protein